MNQRPRGGNRQCGAEGSAVRIGNRSFCLLAAFLCYFTALPGLTGQTPQTTRGTEFWVAFMENLGSGGDLEVSDLRLYMASDSVTTVYVRFLPLDDTLEVEITSPGIPVELRINDFWPTTPPFSSELAGVLPDGTNEISDRSFHITADHEITLYGANLRSLSADAFLALPDNVLSGSYFVLAYQNGYLDADRGNFPIGYDTHSEFAVVATEDNTEVTIYPTAPLIGRPGILAPDSFVVALDRGEVYFGQAVLNARFDVTGTEISATKPVALFGGNQRTAVPTSVGNFRDHLVEQMPPLEAWGTEAYLTPHFTPDTRVTLEAEARIVASADNTVLTITTCVPDSVKLADGSYRDTLTEVTTVDTLDRGEVLEVHPLRAARVVATEPILVAQYEHSVGGDPLEGRHGDPFMMLIPPPEQFDRSYPFQSIVDSGVFSHYVNVVIPRGGEGSLKIDGAPPNPSPDWMKLPGEVYLYAQIRVGGGAHRIEADSAFGLAAYGFGPAMSYGYIGASVFRELPIDYSRPDIEISEACDLVFGSTHDSSENDRGIDSVYATARSSNIALNVDPFVPGQSSVTWRARLVDPYQDGLLEIRVIDRAGRSSTERVGLPGFTVALEAVGSDSVADGEQVVELISYNGKPACADLLLYNYGLHPKVVKNIHFDGQNVPSLTLDQSLPVTLAPGDSLTIRICSPGVELGISDLQIVVEGECASRNPGMLIAGGIIDTIPPIIAVPATFCESGGAIRFSGEDQRYYGIASVVVDTITNAAWRIEPEGLPASSLRLFVDPVDMRRDAIVQVTVTDRAGNVATRRDTIGGFTLAVHDSVLDDTQLAIRLASDWKGEEIVLQGRQCDSLLLVNYGLRDLLISRAYMLGNSILSIPPSQLPLVIRSGEQLPLEFCREGRRSGEAVDTLRLENGCGAWETVALRSPVDRLDGVGRDACGQLITIQASGPPRKTILSAPFPNPSTDGLASVDIGIVEDTDVRIELLDQRGVPVSILLDEPVASGLHRLRFDVSSLGTGSYFCRMTTSDGEVLSRRLNLLR